MLHYTQKKKKGGCVHCSTQQKKLEWEISQEKERLKTSVIGIHTYEEVSKGEV